MCGPHYPSLASARGPVHHAPTRAIYWDTVKSVPSEVMFAMQYNPKVEAVEPSTTVRILDLISDLEADGVDLINLCHGDPGLAFPTPEHIRTAATEALEDGKTHVTASKGIPELREAIARKFTEENDVPTSPEEVIVTTGGAKYALFESVLTLLREDDEVVLFDPSWVSFEPIVEIAGGHTTHLELNAATGFTFDGVDLAAVIDDETRLIVLNNPLNPAGTVVDQEALEALRDLAIDHDVWVLADEVYEKLIYDGQHRSIGALDGMAERTITVNGFSKGYAMEGWRIGYFTGPESFISQVGKVHSNSVTCPTSFAQYGALAALEGPQHPIETLKDRFESRRDTMIDALQEIGIDVPVPQSGLYAFVPVDTDDDVEFCERILQEEHVAMTPGSAFSVDGYVRLTFVVPPAEIKEGIARLADYV